MRGLILVVVLLVGTLLGACTPAQVNAVEASVSVDNEVVDTYEVTWKHGNTGTYDLKNIDPNIDEHETYTLKGDYQVGDTVTILWSDIEHNEVTKEVKLPHINVQPNKQMDL